MNFYCEGQDSLPAPPGTPAKTATATYISSTQFTYANVWISSSPSFQWYVHYSFLCCYVARNTLDLIFFLIMYMYVINCLGLCTLHLIDLQMGIICWTVTFGRRIHGPNDYFVQKHFIPGSYVTKYLLTKIPFVTRGQSFFGTIRAGTNGIGTKDTCVLTCI